MLGTELFASDKYRDWISFDYFEKNIELLKGKKVAIIYLDSFGQEKIQEGTIVYLPIKHKQSKVQNTEIIGYFSLATREGLIEVSSSQEPEIRLMNKKY